MKRSSVILFFANVCLVLMFLSCRETDNHHARLALTQLEEYYIENKSVCDSLESIVEEYFLENGCGSEAEQDMARLFHAERLYDNGAKTEAMKLLVQIRENNLSTLYFKAIKYYLMGEIYFSTRLYDDALQAFQKEAELAELMHDYQKIATAYNHVANTYRVTLGPDSALAYYRRNLSLLPFQDSLSHAIIYNNIAVFYEDNTPDSIHEIELYYLRSLQYDPRYYLSMANLADLYYQTQQIEKADSLVRIILQNNTNANTFTMTYGALHDHFLRMGQTDSAYKYEQLAMHYDSIVHQPEKQKHIVRITEQAKGQAMIQGMSNTLKWVVALSVLTAVLLSCLCIYIYRRHKKRLLLERVRHIQQKERADEAYQVLQESLTDIQVEMKERAEVYKVGQQEMGRQIKQKETLNQLLVENFFLPSQSNHAQDANLYYQAIVNTFTKKNKNHQKFLHELLIACPSLSLREQTHCILLYAEQYNDEEILSLLNFISKPSYYTAKSRLRSKLQKAKQSPAVSAVLKLF